MATEEHIDRWKPVGILVGRGANKCAEVILEATNGHALDDCCAQRRSESLTTPQAPRIKMAGVMRQSVGLVPWLSFQVVQHPSDLVMTAAELRSGIR